MADTGVEDLRAELFGLDDEDDEPAARIIEDDVEDDDVSDYEPPSAPAATDKTGERRAALEALAAKAKQKQQAEGKKAKKKRKGEAGEAAAKRPDKRRRGASPVRPARPAEHASFRGNQRVGRSEALREGPEGAAEDTNIEDFIETDADRAFIDDDGADAADGLYASDGEGGFRLDEAEEEGVNDIDALLAKRKGPKRGKESEEGAQAAVDNMVARMEAAAEQDVETRAAAAPAMAKLSISREVEDFIVQRRYHERFMASHGLVALAKWLAPYDDGSLPHSQVRGSVLRCCELLGIDTGNEQLKQLLGRSGLAKFVMFLSKCSDETVANRKAAAELVAAWSRPIFYDRDAEEAKKQAKVEHLRAAREQSVRSARQADKAPAEARKPAQGEPGFRWHAEVPASAKLDYVEEPASVYDESSAGAYNPKKTRFVTKAREVERKRKETNQRAMKPNVEGRGMIIYS